jgi:hypothetical protein
MGNHPIQTRKTFECRNCGHHRVDHGNGDDTSCYKCDCAAYPNGAARDYQTNPTIHHIHSGRERPEFGRNIIQYSLKLAHEPCVSVAIQRGR